MSGSDRQGNMSPGHCAAVRLLPCLTCGAMPGGTVHHLKSGPAANERALGQKATDRWVLPLCWEPCHRGLEDVGSRNELQWFAERGIVDPIGIAMQLWGVWLQFGRDPRTRPRVEPAMMAIIIRAREGFDV